MIIKKVVLDLILPLYECYSQETALLARKLVPESKVDKLFRSPPFNDEEKVLYQKCPVFDLIKDFTEFFT